MKDHNNYFRCKFSNIMKMTKFNKQKNEKKET